jgi:hypothetical protein
MCLPSLFVNSKLFCVTCGGWDRQVTDKVLTWWAVVWYVVPSSLVYNLPTFERGLLPPLSEWAPPKRPLISTRLQCAISQKRCILGFLFSIQVLTSDLCNEAGWMRVIFYYENVWWKQSVHYINPFSVITFVIIAKSYVLLDMINDTSSSLLTALTDLGGENVAMYRRHPPVHENLIIDYRVLSHKPLERVKLAKYVAALCYSLLGSCSSVTQLTKTFSACRKTKTLSSACFFFLKIHSNILLPSTPGSLKLCLP